MGDAVDKGQAFDEMLELMNRQIAEEGGSYSDWYCGVAELIDLRLYDEHKIPREKGSWWYTWRECFNADNAMSVQSALLKADCDGLSDSGDKDSIYVYAYLKGEETDPGIQCCH